MGIARMGPEAGSHFRPVKTPDWADDADYTAARLTPTG